MALVISAIFLPLIALFRATNAQSIIPVAVGDTGSFFDPQVVAASKGDVINFQWTGMFHSITQSSFADPCTPLPNGFDSGVTGNPTGTLILPEWNLTITDDTQPIWFFCKVTKPVSHCTAGMVGAINAGISTGNQSFNQFVLNAKTLTDPPTLPSGMPPVLTGVGAFATITPVPAHPINATANATSSSSSLSTSSSTLALTSSPTHPASSGVSSSLKGAIAGGVIGGLALIILTALLLMSFRRGRRFRKEAFEAQKTLRSQSSQDMSHFEQRPDLFYNSTYSEPRSPYHPSQGSPSIIDSLEDSTAGPSINIQELAAEIAKNMRQTGVQGQEPTVGLGVILENPSANELPNVNSGRGDDSSRREPTRSEIGQSVRGRQLPRPPPSAFGRQTADDAVSVDTLPAYHADTHS